MTTKIATREAYGKALVELGKIDPDIVVLDADLSKSTKTNDFKQVFPDRHFNMGIAEQNLMGVAAGLAASGKIPFASTFAIFGTGRAYDVIRNLIGYPRLNVKIALTHAGITVGEDGASHQALEDIALMNAIPGMIVLCPADAIETRQAVFAAAEYIGPVYIRLGRSKVDVLFDDDYIFDIGKSTQLTDGDDIAIIATGIMVAKAIEAEKELKQKGINARVINMSTIKPIDSEVVLKAAKETKGIVCCEEHSIIGGLTSMVSLTVSDSHPTIVKSVSVNDAFGESGKPDQLLEKYGLTTQNIIKKVEEIVKG